MTTNPKMQSSLEARVEAALQWGGPPALGTRRKTPSARKGMDTQDGLPIPLRVGAIELRPYGNTGSAGLTAVPCCATMRLHMYAILWHTCAWSDDDANAGEATPQQTARPGFSGSPLACRAHGTTLCDCRIRWVDGNSSPFEGGARITGRSWGCPNLAPRCWRQSRSVWGSPTSFGKEVGKIGQ